MRAGWKDGCEDIKSVMQLPEDRDMQPLVEGLKSCANVGQTRRKC